MQLARELLFSTIKSNCRQPPLFGEHRIEIKKESIKYWDLLPAHESYYLQISECSCGHLTVDEGLKDVSRAEKSQQSLQVYGLHYWQLTIVATVTSTNFTPVEPKPCTSKPNQLPQANCRHLLPSCEL
jgi:hypothetical protein